MQCLLQQRAEWGLQISGCISLCLLSGRSVFFAPDSSLIGAAFAIIGLDGCCVWQRFNVCFLGSSCIWPQSPGHVYVHTSDTVPVKRWGMGCSLTEVSLSEIPVQRISLRKAEAGCGRKGRAAAMNLSSKRLPQMAKSPGHR